MPIVFAGASGIDASDVAYAASSIDCWAGYNCTRAACAAATAAASRDAHSGARSKTAYGRNSLPIELTASKTAACTIATLRVSIGGLNGAAAVVLRAMTFQSSTTSAAAVVGSTAIDAANMSAAPAKRSWDM